MSFKWFLIVVIGYAFAKADYSHAQSSQMTITKIQSLPLKADTFIGVDDFKNFYYINKNTIYKKGPRDNHQYAALQLGAISSVDILNPLKITVFYESANTAVILDNTLNEIRRINFSSIQEFRNVSHATTANDRRLWIFNTDLQQLEIYDYGTDRIAVQFPPKDANAIAQASNFNFCWLVTQDGIFTYNNYGAFLSELPFKIAGQIQQANGNIIVYSDNTFIYKTKDIADFETLLIDEIDVKQFSLNNEILYIYDGLKVTSFSLKPPKK